MSPGNVNGGLALRETARAKRQWNPGSDGKVMAAGSAREGHLPMEGIPDQGNLGSVTRTLETLILAGCGILSEPSAPGANGSVTGVSEARSYRSSDWEDNAHRPAGRSAEADLVA